MGLRSQTNFLFYQRSYFKEVVIDDAIATFLADIKPILGHDLPSYNMKSTIN